MITNWMIFYWTNWMITNWMIWFVKLDDDEFEGYELDDLVCQIGW